MKHEVKTQDEAVAFVLPLIESGKYHVDVFEVKERGVIEIQWIEKKQYIAYGDKKQYIDECWMAEDGTMYNVQDLTEDHAKNIIRMMIRQDREERQAIMAVAAQLRSTMEGILPSSELEEGDEITPDVTINTNTGRILH